MIKVTYRNFYIISLTALFQVVCDGQLNMILIPVNTNQLDFLPSLLPDQDESVSSNHSGFHPSEPTETQHTLIFPLWHKTKYANTLQQLTTTSDCFLAGVVPSFLLGVLPPGVGKSVPVSFLYCAFRSNSCFTPASTAFCKKQFII